jgi:hypothetical protein
MKRNAAAVIFGVAIVLASVFLANGYVERSRKQRTIDVTGLGTTDFKSDLIVWDGEVSVLHTDLSSAYQSLNATKSKVREYLLSKGLKKEEVVFAAVNSREKNRSIYNAEGNYVGEEFEGYELEQTFTVESKDVEKVEEISRSITELLNEGMQLYSYAPRYYYTKLADLKLEMIAKATKDARARAENITTNAGTDLGDVIEADMGVFQITGQNSNEEYSWGGTFNTSSKNKTATITVKLSYELD